MSKGSVFLEEYGFSNVLNDFQLRKRDQLAIEILSCLYAFLPRYPSMFKSPFAGIFEI